MRVRLLMSLAVAAMCAAASPAAGAECTCLANGVRYKEGEVVCLRLSPGPKLARCEKVLNNTSWKILRDGCVDTSAVKARSGFAAAVPGAGTLAPGRPAGMCRRS